jgi:hypothetical protein
MIEISSELFGQHIKAGNIYYFTSTQLNTNIPHYFICIVRDDGDYLILTCCTTQFEKRQAFIEGNNLPNSTLVWIAAPNNENKLPKDSYVDCNNCFEYTVAELQAKHENGEIKYKGEVSENHFLQIVTGLKDSPLIENDVKNMLPKLN